MKKRYNDYGTWIREQFPFRVQKISVDAGFSCPNRDGKVGRGGCVFCDNRTFNPAYCEREKSITEQIIAGKEFFKRKYPDMKYLAYFQAYSNTYADVETLKRRYEEALSVEDVVGIVIGTRPDCVPDDTLDYLDKLNRQTFMIVEYGIESANDETLRIINRGHSFECSADAMRRTADRGIITGGHVIIGLPGEGPEECLRQADIISSLPLNILKLHQMQVVKGTRLAEMNPYIYNKVEDYIRLVAEYISRLRPDLILERFVSQSPKGMVIAPSWGLKNHEFTNLLDNYLREHDITQGCSMSRFQSLR
ncbi:MAG: TIGR01212 family radical SAM protein [Prevotellaceae bacterium]|nr:TIGR01212 family radical SAM protein [Prevotellaceae bacterium]